MKRGSPLTANSATSSGPGLANYFSSNTHCFLKRIIGRIMVVCKINMFLKITRARATNKTTFLGYQEAAGRHLGFLGAMETPPKIEVPKVLCFTVLEPATTHFAAEWRR